MEKDSLKFDFLDGGLQPNRVFHKSRVIATFSFTVAEKCISEISREQQITIKPMMMREYSHSEEERCDYRDTIGEFLFSFPKS